MGDEFGCGAVGHADHFFFQPPTQNMRTLASIRGAGIIEAEEPFVKRV